MISIITASYNRAYIIEALYSSLLSQTSKDFEWIVVDDGSSDNTFEMVSNWKEECKDFPISIYRQANGGKHRAVNAGVAVAKGDYCFIVDSDDSLSVDAIETIEMWWSQCADNEYIAAVSGLKGAVCDHKKIGGFPSLKGDRDYIEAKNTERRKLNLLGDKAEVYRTSLLKANPFRCYEGERFISENTVWDEIAYQGYKIRWHNKVIYYCEYLSDGLTKSGDKKEIQNFRGFTYYTQQRIKCYNVIEGIIARGYFLNVAFKKGLKLTEASNTLGCAPLTLLVCYWVWKCKNLLLVLKR